MKRGRHLGRLSSWIFTLPHPALLAAALIIVVAGCSEGGSGLSRKPNVLLVSVDTLRSDHLSCYGYGRNTSPAIDSLASEGVLFEDAVAPTPWTLPSHVTLMTGVPPLSHGVVRNNSKMGKDLETLAQVLGRAGYRTAGFVSGPYLQSTYGFSRGFDHYDDQSTKARRARESHSVITSPLLLEMASAWLKQWRIAQNQDPFFVFLHLWDVHYDFVPPEPFDSMFDPDYEGEIDGRNFERGTRVHAAMDPRDLEHVQALYDGEIRFTDQHLGKVLELLRAMEVYDDTIVVLTSDHGEEFFEHGYKGHRRALYEESVAVPLIVRYPRKVPAGRRVHTQVRLMDVGSTILDLAEIDAPSFARTKPGDEMSAQTLVPVLNSELDNLPGLPARGSVSTIESMRAEGFKLISTENGQELYDLRGDPGESVNLISERPEVAKRLQQLEAQWLARWLPKTETAESVVLDTDQEERLRSLGYLE